MRHVIYLIFSLLCFSCGKDTLPKYVLLGDLRILTLKASQPEVSPGSTVTLQPVVSDISAGGRTLQVTVLTCVDPGVSLGNAAVCATPDTTTTSSFSTSSLDTNGSFTGAAPTVSVTVPATPSNYTLSPSYKQYNGVAYLVFYTVTASDGASVTAFKRIIVSSPSKATKNSNPSIGGLAANGNALAALNTFTAALLNLQLSLSSGAESYQSMNADGSLASLTESISSTWFISDGTMEYMRSAGVDANQWTPPSAKPSSRPVTLVVVTRDGRGGEDFQQFDFH